MEPPETIYLRLWRVEKAIENSSNRVQKHYFNIELTLLSCVVFYFEMVKYIEMQLSEQKKYM